MSDLGHMCDGRFVMPIRVYYADTDAGGVVYHANYLKFAEVCRSEYLRLLGLPLVGDRGENFVVKNSMIDWNLPVRLDDLMNCYTSAVSIGAAKLCMLHEFECRGRVVCRVEIVLVYVSRHLKPIKIGSEFREKLSPKPG